MRESDAQEAVRFGVARRKRFQRLGPLQQISRLFEYLGAQRVQTRRLTERSSNSAPNAASSLCTCRVIAEGVRNRRSAARAMDPAWANSTRARKSSSKGTS